MGGTGCQLVFAVASSWASLAMSLTSAAVFEAVGAFSLAVDLACLRGVEVLRAVVFLAEEAFFAAVSPASFASALTSALAALAFFVAAWQIGRASCRERVCQYV